MNIIILYCFFFFLKNQNLKASFISFQKMLPSFNELLSSTIKPFLISTLKKILQMKTLFIVIKVMSSL